MSLYNLLFGVNPLAKVFMEILGLDKDDGRYPTGRFRDIFYDKKKNMIILYTRNGGGNREEYQHVFDMLGEHPNYIRDYDDSFDETYAYVEFSVPAEYKKILDDMVIDSDIENVHQKFERIIKEMDTMSEDEIKKDKRFDEIRKIFKTIVEVETNNNKQEAGK